MKSHYILFQLLFLFCLSCKFTTKNIYLEKAEKQILINPDSSFRLLQLIQNPQQLNEKEYAYYGLLMTEALDKTYQPLSDTLLSLIANYYLNQNDNTIEKAKTWFYLGRFNYQTYSHKEAQKCYFEALKILEKSKEYYLLSLIHYHLGTLYRDQELYKDALKKYKLSYYYDKKQKEQNPVNIAYSLSDIARTFSYLEQNDSAQIYYQQSLSLINKTNNHIAKSYIWNGLSNYYKNIKNYSHALEAANNSIYFSNDSIDIFHTYLVKAEIYLETHQYDSAYIYLNLIKNSPHLYVQIDRYKLLYKFYSNKKDYKKANNIANTYFSYQDSINKVIKWEEIKNIEKRYHYDQLISKSLVLTKKLQNNRLQFYQYTIITLIIIISLYLCYLIKLKIKNKELFYKDQLIKKYEQEKSRTSLTINEQEKILKSLQKEYYHLKFTIYQSTSIFKRIEKIKYEKVLPISKSEEDDIINTINRLFNQYAFKLQNLTNLSNSQICYCCILCFHSDLSSVHHAMLFNVSDRGIQQRRYRIRKALNCTDNNKDLTEILYNLINM